MGESVCFLKAGLTLGPVWSLPLLVCDDGPIGDFGMISLAHCQLGNTVSLTKFFGSYFDFWFKYSLPYSEPGH